MDEATQPSNLEVRAAWIEAARPRTLPLAASGSVVAAGVAAAAGSFRPEILVLMLLVSILLQVIANFADDYGDLSHGLDDETRVGPKRGMQRGIITPAQMRVALIVACACALVLGVLLIYVSLSAGPALGEDTMIVGAILLVLGVAAIAAAVLYTVGPHPYGYQGLGDLMSFIFFGLVAVVAGSFLHTHTLGLDAMVMGIALGMPVAAVMNINNMRDATDDAAKGKRTVANRLYAAGERRGHALAAGRTDEQIAAMVAVVEHGPRSEAAVAPGEMTGATTRLAALTGERYMRIYHAALIYAALILFCAGLFLARGASFATCLGAAAVCLAAMPLFQALSGVTHELDHTKLDRFMAPTSMGTVLVAIVWTLACALI